VINYDLFEAAEILFVLTITL